MLNRFSIKHRLYLIMGLMLLLSGLSAYFITTATTTVKQTALNQLDRITQTVQKEKLKSVTHAIAVALGKNLGKLDTETEKIKQLQSFIDPIRFEADKSGYFYAYKGTVNVAHPMKKSLIGKDLKDLKDSTGVYPIRALEKAAESGGGFCFFTWDKPGTGPTLKLGYAEFIPGTRIWVGTGLYMDNLQVFKDHTGQILSEKVSRVLMQMGVTGGIVLLLILVVCLSVVSGITSSMKSMLKGVSHVQKGDFTRRINLTATDEIGELSRVFDTFTKTMNRSMGDVLDQSQTINHLSDDLNDLSAEMSEAAATSSAQARDAAMESEEMTGYMVSVAKVMETTTGNITQIAAATEEISATIKEITGHTQHTVSTTETATREAMEAASKMDELTRRTNEINSVTQAIQEISEQTHLLALNATIEASRAGAAGRGFAVVADEIKALAKQTATATEEIRHKVEAIQATVGQTRQGILGVEKVVQDTNSAVALVQTSVSEQALSTEEINKTLQETSSGIAEVSASVDQASQMAKKISQQISLVFSSASQIAGDSRLVRESADELNRTAENFSRMGEAFVTSHKGFRAGAAKRAHNAWKKKLSDMLTGKTPLAPSDVSDHHRCDFGNWYFNEGQSLYGSLGTFRAIDQKHEAVHKAAKRISALFQEGKKQEANALFLEFRGITQNLFELLEQLEEETAEMGDS